MKWDGEGVGKEGHVGEGKEYDPNILSEILNNKQSKYKTFSNLAPGRRNNPLFFLKTMIGSEYSKHTYVAWLPRTASALEQFSNQNKPGRKHCYTWKWILGANSGERKTWTSKGAHHLVKAVPLQVGRPCLNSLHMVPIHREFCISGSPNPCWEADSPGLYLRGKPSFYWCLLSPRKRKVSHSILTRSQWDNQSLPAHKPTSSRKPHHPLPVRYSSKHLNS